MTLGTRAVVWSALLAAALAFSVAGAESEDIEPEAKALFDSWANAVGESESVAFRVEQTMKMPAMFGMEIEQTWTTRYAFDPPNRFRFDISFSEDEDDEMFGFYRLMNTVVYSDGEEVITHYPELALYGREPAPASLAEWWERQGDEMGMDMPMNMGTPLPGILTGRDLDNEFLEGVTAMYMGEETIIDGETAQTVHAESADGSVTSYFIPGDPLLLRRLVFEIQLADQLGLDAEEMEELRSNLEELQDEFEQDEELMELLGDEKGLYEWFSGDSVMTLELNLSDWRLGETLPEDLFAANIPDDHEESDNIEQAMHERLMEAMSEMMPEFDLNGTTELVGTSAPPFALNLLGDGEMDLAEHIGKHVVVLDFWATWCPPCVRALPILDQVTRDPADEGVVFYAVNVGEDEDTVASFMAEREMDFPVAMDREGHTAEEYSVISFPTTVLIGSDGVIEAVHVGLLPDLEERLREELTALAEGESLIDD